MIDRKMCVYSSHQLGCGEFCVFNKMSSGSTECCCCSSWSKLWKSNVTQMGTGCFAFLWISSMEIKKKVLFSAKATGGRKDFNNVTWHAEQWLAVRIVAGVHWIVTFEERSCWAFWKSGSFCQSHFIETAEQWANKSIAYHLHHQELMLSHLLSKPCPVWLTVNHETIESPQKILHPKL